MHRPAFSVVCSLMLLIAAAGAFASFEAPLRRLGLDEKRKRLAERISEAATLSQSLSTLGAGHATQIRDAAKVANTQTAAALPATAKPK